MLQFLRENVRLCAQCLVIGEGQNKESMQMAASTLISSVYANCILPEDELQVLNLLKYDLLSLWKYLFFYSKIIQGI